MSSFGELVKVGVQGAGSYGAGLARYLTGQGVEVAEPAGPAAGAASPTPRTPPPSLAALDGEASRDAEGPRRAVEASPDAAGRPRSARAAF